MGSVQAGVMILTEHGLHFQHAGEYWQCVEWPDLLMLRDGGYRVGQKHFDEQVEALRYVRGGFRTISVQPPQGPS